MKEDWRFMAGWILMSFNEQVFGCALMNQFFGIL